MDLGKIALIIAGTAVVAWFLKVFSWVFVSLYPLLINFVDLFVSFFGLLHYHPSSMAAFATALFFSFALRIYGFLQGFIK